MADYRQLNIAAKNAINPDPIRAQTGYNIGGVMRTIDPDDTSLMWVRHSGTAERVPHRGRVANSPYIDVELEYEHDGTLVIARVDLTKAKQLMGKKNIGRIENGAQVKNRFIGGDPVDLRMISQLGVRRAGGLELKVLKGMFSHNGVLIAWENDSETVDFTSLLPSTDYNHRWGVLGFKTDVDPVELYITAGDEVNVTTPLDLAMLVEVVNEDFIIPKYKPLLGCQLRYNQTVFTERDFEAIASVVMGDSGNNNGGFDEVPIWLHWGF